MCASVMTDVQRVKGTTLEVSHLRVAMNMYYRSVYKKANSGSGDDEMALATQDNDHNKNKEMFWHLLSLLNG